MKANTALPLTPYTDAVESHKQDFDFTLARKRAFHTRSKAIEHLDKHLIDFETHFTRHQGKMMWAPNAENAKTELRLLLKDKAVYTVAHPFLKELELQHEESWTYLGQEHVPEIKEDGIALVFPSFYISENGSLILQDHIGLVDILLSRCQKIVYALGIEQVCPNLNEAENLLNLLARFGEGQKDFSSIHISFGNRQVRESDGPKESWVLMLDNGRSSLLAEIPQRQALYCIHCGACERHSNFMGVHQNLTPAIKLIQAPFTLGAEHFQDNFMLPLSGRATKSCPIGIDLKGLILENRHVAVDRKLEGRSDALAWKTWKTAMMNRKWINKSGSIKNFTLKSFFKKYWGEGREFPKTADKSFNEWWLESRGKSGV